MILVRRVVWGALGISLVVSALFGISILSGTDSRVEAGAANTEITMGRCPQSGCSSIPTYVSSVVLVQGGDGLGPSPCSAGETDATTDCLYVWAKNVDNVFGASAFQVRATYNSTLVQADTIAHSVNWLASTGRSATCVQPEIVEDLVTGAGSATVSCNTLLAPPPYGPKCPSQCNGQLAMLAFESEGMGLGTTTLNFSESYLVDTPPDPDDATAIPATVRSVAVTVAKCADFTGAGGNPDGTIRVNDILFVVQAYFTPAGDLDGDGTTRVADILIAVKEYFQTCTQ